MPPSDPFVQLLGPAGIQTHGERYDFADDKRFQLLGFLAYDGDWVQRERLAYLFWPDVPSPTARQRLRQLLKRVRLLKSPIALEREGGRVRWRVATDVRTFRSALDSGNLERALELYSGPLLEGMEGDSAPEFAAWLEFERAALHDRWRALLLERAERVPAGAPTLELLAGLLQRDEFDEEALRAYLTALTGADRRPQALETYAAFAARLQASFGIEPALATQRVADAIRLQHPPRPATRTAARTPRPAAPASTFVGRDAELSNVARLLAQPSCRLLTLVGLGGVGKSRLAWRTAAATRSDGGTAHFIRLDALSSPSAIAAAIADGLGASLLGERDPLEQLALQIGPQSLLLVLDNYEHLIAGAAITTRLLEACPGLTLLVTSRERLGVPTEWIYEVTGLGFPAADVPLERALGYDAVQLFVARAGQVRAGYELDDADLPHVLTICRRVRGLPLGLELAAAWMRSMTAADIADEIAGDTDFLHGRGTPERHGSIRAVFESSWRLLIPEEQRVLATLSVFRGGFDRAAAAPVALASTPLLAALVDKSLLDLGAAGRYDRHPLLYRYASEKLGDGEDAAAAHRRHARYFLTLAEEVGGRLRGVSDMHDIDALEADHENLRVALRWSATHEPLSALRMAGALSRFWEIRGHLVEGVEWLATALAAAADPPPGVAARAHAGYGRLLFLRGHKGAAEPHFERARELARAADDDLGIAGALNHLAMLAMERGAYAAAEAHQREALALSRARGDRTGVANLLNNLGETARLRGDHAAAEAHYRECLALQRAEGNQRGTAIVLGNLGSVLGVRGELGPAVRHLRESIVLKDRLRDGIGLAYCFAGLAGVLTDAGAAADAARLLGAVDALIELHSVELDVADRGDHDATLARTQRSLGDAPFAAAQREGRALSRSDAIALALAACDAVLRRER